MRTRLGGSSRAAGDNTPVRAGSTSVDGAIGSISDIGSGAADPARDEQGMAYLRIFGLDREDAAGRPVPDGVWDSHRNEVFDLSRGLLRFPWDFPRPFAGSPEQYAAFVNDPAWTWSPAFFLAGHLAPELYSPLTHPDDLPSHGWFEIVLALRGACSATGQRSAAKRQPASQELPAAGRQFRHIGL